VAQNSLAAGLKQKGLCKVQLKNAGAALELPGRRGLKVLKPKASPAQSKITLLDINGKAL